MRILASVFGAGLVALLALAMPLAIHAESADGAGKIEALLAQSGYKYERRRPTVWFVPATLEKLGARPVIISSNDDLAVTFLIVAESKDINKTPQLMQALLRSNGEYDYVKVGFDSGGDLFVRIDSPIRQLDVEKLKADIEQVKRVSDIVFGLTKE